MGGLCKYIIAEALKLYGLTWGTRSPFKSKCRTVLFGTLISIHCVELCFKASNITRWWFQIVFKFTPTWGRFPFWLIFFKLGWNHQLNYIVSYYWYVLSKLQNKICHAYLVHGVISSKANMFEDAPRERNWVTLRWFFPQGNSKQHGFTKNKKTSSEFKCYNPKLLDFICNVLDFGCHAFLHVSFG